MATATRDLSFSTFAYCKEANKTTHYNTNTSTEYLLNDDSSLKDNFLLYGGLASWPSSLKRNRIIKSSLRAYVKAGSGYLILEGVKAFNASTVTYNTMPARNYADGSAAAEDLGVSVGAWKNVWVPIEDLYDTDAEAAIKMLKDKSLYLTGPLPSSNQWYAKTVLADGSTRPSLRVYYDDAVIITSKVVIGTRISGSVNPKNAQTVSWSLQKNSSYYCLDEVWTQASAKFFWKASDASTWNAINVSGSATQLTIPAYTFPTGKTIQYYIQATDTDGTTTNTSTYTFTTPPSQITVQNSPTSGYVNPRNAVTFSWYFAYTNGNYPQQSAKLYWRVAGASSWNEVAASGTTQSLTIPAYPATGSFPIASTIEWYVYGVDSSGSASQTPVYSFTTAAATAYATVNSPDGSVEDGSAPITFRWTLTSADGLQMSQVDLWWKLPSEPSNSWHIIVESSDPISEYTVPANYFNAGEVEWLVHAYNIDGTRGPDSQSSFICVAAPNPVLGLVATPVPITTISWQSTEQEAYEITIDGEVVAKAFGVGVYSWKATEPLPDGEHIISVRIQGVYGLWSQPATTSIFVTNEPELTNLRLTGKFCLDASLRVYFAGEEGEEPAEDPAELPADIQWYRDGKRIAWTTGTDVFSDRFVLGQHTWYAEVWHDSGYYSRTNPVSGRMDTDRSMIALASGGEWIDIGLSDKSNGEQNFTWSRNSVSLHILGATYPIVEVSPFEDISGRYDIAFADKDAAKAFENLKGKRVILKSRRENVIVGVLTQLSKRETLFYTAFSFALQQIHWEDFVRYDTTD